MEYALLIYGDEKVWASRDGRERQLTTKDAVEQAYRDHWSRLLALLVTRSAGPGRRSSG